MKTKSFGIFAASACLASLIASPASAADQKSPFLGKWELDLAKMPDTYGPAPKRVTFSFSEVGSDQWRTTVEIIGRDDSLRHISIQYRRDGRAARGEGDNSEGDTAAFMSPAPNILVMSQAKEKALAGVRVYSISADGNEMTESAANVDQSGAPFVRTFHFKKMADQAPQPRPSGEQRLRREQ